MLPHIGFLVKEDKVGKVKRGAAKDTLKEGRRKAERLAKEDSLKLVTLEVIRKVKVLEVASVYGSPSQKKTALTFYNNPWKLTIPKLKGTGPDGKPIREQALKAGNLDLDPMNTITTVKSLQAIEVIRLYVHTLGWFHSGSPGST
jgi:hypothetical protein